MEVIKIKISGDDIQNLTNPDTSESQFISEPPDVASPPNIIIILGDNHNAGIMGCSGHLFIKTPNLDQLADEGVMMTNTFSTTPLCILPEPAF